MCSRLFLHPLDLVSFSLFLDLHCLFSVSLPCCHSLWFSQNFLLFCLLFLLVCCFFWSLAIFLFSASFSFTGVALTCGSSGFPVSFLGYSVLFPLLPASGIDGSFLRFLCFLPTFVPLGASCLCSPGVILSLRPSVLPDCLSLQAALPVLVSP